MIEDIFKNTDAYNLMHSLFFYFFFYYFHVQLNLFIFKMFFLLIGVELLFL